MCRKTVKDNDKNYIYRGLAGLQAFRPHLRNCCLNHLQSFIVGQLQLFCLFVKLEQHQHLQQVVDFLCQGELTNKVSPRWM